MMRLKPLTSNTSRTAGCIAHSCERDARTLRRPRAQEEDAQAGARDVIERGAIDDQRRWRRSCAGEGLFELL